MFPDSSIWAVLRSAAFQTLVRTAQISSVHLMNHSIGAFGCQTLGSWSGCLARSLPDCPDVCHEYLLLIFLVSVEGESESCFEVDLHALSARSQTSEPV